MASQTDNNYRGKVSVNAILLTNKQGDKVIDLSKSYAEFNIYEDIFSPFISGNILLVDSLNLMQELPILGEELIEIDFSTIGDDEDRFSKQFIIHNITDRSIDGEQTESFVLHFISPSYFDAISTVTSQSFTDEKLDKVVEKLVGKSSEMSLIGVETHQTLDTQSIIIPQLNVIRGIELVKKRSLNTSRVNDFLFYETRESFHFKSLSDLMTEDFTKPLYYLPNTGISFKNYPKDLGISSVQDFVVDREKVMQQINNGKNIVKGMYANRLIAFDPVRKKYEEVDHSLSDDRNKFGRLDTGNFYSNDFASEFSSRPKSKINLHVTGTDDNVEDWLPTRSVQKALIENIRIQVTINGILSFTSGETTYYARRNANPASNNVEYAFDKYLEGKYLISAVKHNITPDTFKTDIELIRDSYMEQP